MSFTERAQDTRVCLPPHIASTSCRARSYAEDSTAATQDISYQNTRDHAESLVGQCGRRGCGESSNGARSDASTTPSCKWSTQPDGLGVWTDCLAGDETVSTISPGDHPSNRRRLEQVCFIDDQTSIPEDLFRLMLVEARKIKDSTGCRPNPNYRGAHAERMHATLFEQCVGHGVGGETRHLGSVEPLRLPRCTCHRPGHFFSFCTCGCS